MATIEICEDSWGELRCMRRKGHDGKHSADHEHSAIIEALEARCLAAETTVKHHEHYVKTSVSIVAECEASLAELRAAAGRLVASLPKCTFAIDEYTECLNVATRAWGRGGRRWCDEHEYGDAPEYPRAAPLRDLLKLLQPVAEEKEK